MEVWQRRDNPGILVEAVRLNEENVHAAALWCGAEEVEEIDPEHPQEMQTGLNVTTGSGEVKRASLGMYVIRYAGGFNVFHNRVFELDYEPRDRPAPPPESAGDSRKARGFRDPFDLGRMGP